MAYYFRSRIAEHLFGCRIPTCDDAVEGLAYDRIDRVCDDCGEASHAVILQLAFGNVAGHDDDTDHLPLLVADGDLIGLDPDLHSVPFEHPLNNSESRHSQADDLQIIEIKFSRLLRIDFKRRPSFNLLDGFPGRVR